MEARERIICALDVDNAYRAIQLVGLLKEYVGVFKVGLELTTTTGIQILQKLKDAGAERIFLDAKLHDIPNTVAGAMSGVVRMGVWCVTVHATGGFAMLKAAVDAARKDAEEDNCPRPKVLAVTVLTSITDIALRDELQVTCSLQEHVVHLARLAREAGCDGVVASPREIAGIRASIPFRDFLIVTPGVRPIGAEKGDQARVMTPAEAISRGASYLVIGRPIVASPDPIDAAVQIAEEIAGV